MKPKLRILATILLLFIFFAPAWGNPGPASRSGEPPWWFFAMIASIYCGAFLIMGVYYVLLILALVDIARAQNEGNWKLMWALISIFAGIIGIAVYYFVGRRDRLPPKPKATS